MERPKHHPFAFPSLLIGSSLLAFGPWLVRLSEVGPVAAGFWRLSLALPFLLVIARVAGQPVHWPGRALGMIIAFAALFFAADLAAWHAGIHMTKLGNATLFGNVASFAFAVGVFGWHGVGRLRSRVRPSHSRHLGRLC